MEYIVTSSRLKSLKKRGGSICCVRCGESFKIGDKIVSRPKGHRYHIRCFEKMYVDLED